MTIDTRLTEVDLANPSYLLISVKDGLPDVVPLKAGSSVFVGAGSSCKIQLKDESVRQLHCMFLLGDNGDLTVQDWNTGATYLNGQVVSEEAVMQSGDMVSIGRYCFTAVLDADFHNGVAVDLLCGDDEDGFVNDDAEPEDLELASELLTQIEPSAREEPSSLLELGSQDQSRPDQIEHAAIEAGFNIGDDLSVEFDSEAQQTAEIGFKYDIDADLKDGLSDTQAFHTLPASPRISFSSGDVSGDDETSLLLMEIEQLRFELTDRDSQILALTNDRVSTNQISDNEDSDTIKLVSRLEDLLVELQTSDDRIQSLEDLLRLSDDATVAERDERAQMEKWVSEIENRIGQRELESQAEVDRLHKQLQVAKDDSVVLQTQLHSLSVVGADKGREAEAVTALNNKVEQLRARLQQANERNQELLDRPVLAEEEVDLRAQLLEAKDELAKLRLEASQGRAETARSRAELERMRSEIEQNLSQKQRGGDDADDRIRAMREHLKEIHEQEKASEPEQKTVGLGGRIANLLSQLR